MLEQEKLENSQQLQKCAVRRRPPTAQHQRRALCPGLTHRGAARRQRDEYEQLIEALRKKAEDDSAEVCCCSQPHGRRSVSDAALRRAEQAQIVRPCRASRAAMMTQAVC